MGDHWNGWIDDGPDFDGGHDGYSDGGSEYAPADDGYPVEGLGPADDLTGGGGAGDPGPIGYGDEPFDPDAGPAADPGLGFADAAPSTADAGWGPADADPGHGGADADSGWGPVDADSRIGPADAEVGFGPAGPPVGADPDLVPYADAETWPQPVFPDAFDSGVVPEPVDGFPWADPAALGDPGTPPPAPQTGDTGAPEPTELAGYAAQDLPPDVDPWTALAESDDPATSALARFWAPPER